MDFKRFAQINFLVLLFCPSMSISGQNKSDSIYQLDEVTITQKSFKEVIPAQKLSGDDLKALNSFSVADAIRYFSGIQVKDYGGIGGIKTVNIRSLGTNHIGVFYDGIQLGNAQNGQVDLGKFSLDNMEEISLYNGQKSEIFQPAKDFGSSGSIYLRTRTPKFDKGKNYNLRASVKTGSFDLINPSILYEGKLSNSINLSVNGELINSSGKYKYTYKRVFPNTNQIMYDTTATRKNGDVFSYRLESGLYGVIKDGFWKVKTYFYHSNKGIPGAIVNNVWKNAQRQKDTNIFTQGSFQKNISSKYQIQANVKYAYDYMHYVNPDTTLMLIDNTFRQRELYLSLANKFSITNKWDIALSTDMQYNTLRSNLEGFVYPKRTTTLIALASSLEVGKVKMQGSILGTFVNEKIKHGNTIQADSVKSAPNKNEFTPAFFFSYKPFQLQDLSFRAFYKKIFRMPTFNDLYYTDIGNVALKPEFTHQYNVGVHYGKYFKNTFWNQIQLQVDAYYNEVTNKIIAVPKGSGQYRWMMMNLGKVEVRGIEASVTNVFQFPYDILLNLRLSYTYQKAQDYTKRKSQELQDITYGGQIPYIPWHSGSVIASLSYKDWFLNYSFIYVGERYHNSANIKANYEEPWYTHDMSVVKNFKMNTTNMRIALEINNLLSQNYEVVLNYPMPKRNFKISLSLEI